MDPKQALDIVRKQLKEERYIHTLGVVESSIQLAKMYQVNEKKGRISGNLP